MSLFGRKKKVQNGDPEVRTKDFFDCILPGTMKFFANFYIVGDTYRCVWVIREYPPTTEEQAILAQLADRTGVTLRLYHRRVTPVEEKQIVNNAARKNRLMAGDHDITQAMEAEGNLQDVQTLLATMRNNREILLHCSVYMELKARSMETLEQLQSQIAIHSMCVGSESRYFNGHTNIVDDKFLCFGVKGLMDTNKRLKDAILFNILSYMSNRLIGIGDSVAAIDELYLFLTNQTAIEYIRNSMKRVRKKDSCVVLASQNIEDFLIPSIREFTKPMFSIPTHQFLFYPGAINPKDYMDALQVDEAEYELIRNPDRGVCLYRCGGERYYLQVQVPDYKEALFGKAGGR